MREAEVGSLKLPVTKTEIVVTGIISCIATLLAGLAALFGLFFSFYEQDLLLLSFPFGAILMWCVLSRLWYLPLEITDSHLVAKHLIWTVRLPIKDIKRIKVTTYNDKLPLRLKVIECESVLLCISNLLLRYVYFIRRPKEHAMGDYLLERVRALNPDATIDVW